MWRQYREGQDKKVREWLRLYMVPGSQPWSLEEDVALGWNEHNQKPSPSLTPEPPSAGTGWRCPWRVRVGTRGHLFSLHLLMRFYLHWLLDRFFSPQFIGWAFSLQYYLWVIMPYSPTDQSTLLSNPAGVSIFCPGRCHRRLNKPLHCNSASLITGLETNWPLSLKNDC